MLRFKYQNLVAVITFVVFGLILLSTFYRPNFHIPSIQDLNIVIRGSLSEEVVPTENEKVKACFVILIRNRELDSWRITMQNLEDRFNRKFNYPYVFLNDEPFTDEFKKHTQALTKAKVEFGLIPKEHWSIPEFIDKGLARKKWQEMVDNDVMYGGSESYRHMCRFESGFFFRHNLTLQYDYYWRVEPGIEFSCDIDEDPFRFMKENKKEYGFVIALEEIKETIPTLWPTVKSWIKDTNADKYFPKDNALKFLSDDNGDTYTTCHFWSNFEIASFNLWRDEKYLNYFDYLDKKGGFFYERWGDAPVHSIYAALALRKDQIHFFNGIGYLHLPYLHCPTEPELAKKCTCKQENNFDFQKQSCAPRFFKMVGHK